VLLSGSGRTNPRTRIWREVGISGSFKDIVTALGGPAWQRHVPYAVIARIAFAEIAWGASSFRQTLDPVQRLALAARVASGILKRHGLDGRPVSAWMRAYAKRLVTKLRESSAAS
jgi:hypothetical protein